MVNFQTLIEPDHLGIQTQSEKSLSFIIWEDQPANDFEGIAKKCYNLNYPQYLKLFLFL